MNYFLRFDVGLFSVFCFPLQATLWISIHSIVTPSSSSSIFLTYFFYLIVWVFFDYISLFLFSISFSFALGVKKNNQLQINTGVYLSSPCYTGLTPTNKGPHTHSLLSFDVTDTTHSYSPTLNCYCIALCLLVVFKSFKKKYEIYMR